MGVLCVRRFGLRGRKDEKRGATHLVTGAMEGMEEHTPLLTSYRACETIATVTGSHIGTILEKFDIFVPAHRRGRALAWCLHPKGGQRVQDECNKRPKQAFQPTVRTSTGETPVGFDRGLLPFGPEHGETNAAQVLTCGWKNKDKGPKDGGTAGRTTLK
jgi:hypothetical protein